MKSERLPKIQAALKRAGLSWMFPSSAASKRVSNLERKFDERCGVSERTAESTVEDRFVNYEPQTEFGRRMLERRRAIEASGEELLTREQVREELRTHRGEQG